ncbi:MAG: hypothetical protein KA885_07000 [Spirochaetes bacterium]|nr:hypothetical protein [Spirochaetota bacterium]
MLSKIVEIKNLKEKNRDYLYWLNKSPEDRFGEVENIRKEYNGENYAYQSGFQRVFRVIKQK